MIREGKETVVEFEVPPPGGAGGKEVAKFHPNPNLVLRIPRVGVLREDPVHAVREVARRGRLEPEFSENCGGKRPPHAR